MDMATTQNFQEANEQISCKKKRRKNANLAHKAATPRTWKRSAKTQLVNTMLKWKERTHKELSKWKMFLAHKDSYQDSPRSNMKVWSGVPA